MRVRGGGEDVEFVRVLEFDGLSWPEARPVVVRSWVLKRRGEGVDSSRDGVWAGRRATPEEIASALLRLPPLRRG